ncbi:DUF928 domain-containing protein [Chitinophaga costaii]|nr:DUF928 domain-containing protein [Chitinophaga costaii]
MWCLATGMESHAQVSFVFVPAVQGRTLDGLLKVKLINSGNPGVASLLVTVTDTRGARMVTLKTPPFQVIRGVNSVPAAAVQRASINFAQGQGASLLRQSGFFPAGDYEYCFELSTEKGEDIEGNQCFDYELEPFSPLLLTTPAEKDQLCDKRPSFFWQPLLPLVPGMQYRLVLTEIKEGQAPIEALHYNLPLVNQVGISGPFLFFPPSAPELQEGHHYVWQVTAYKGDLVLQDSEVWDFSMVCKDSTPALPVDAFRDIEDLVRANFYLAMGALQFSVQNVYDKTTLQYIITCITDPSVKVKSLPEIKLQHGLNNLRIDLQNNKAFRDGNYYLLTVMLPSGTEKKLRFQYKDPQQ